MSERRPGSGADQSKIAFASEKVATEKYATEKVLADDDTKGQLQYAEGQDPKKDIDPTGSKDQRPKPDADDDDTGGQSVTSTDVASVSFASEKYATEKFSTEK
jgi:hypothetical protein